MCNLTAARCELVKMVCRVYRIGEHFKIDPFYAVDSLAQHDARSL